MPNLKEKHGVIGSIRKSGTRMVLTTTNPLGRKVDARFHAWSEEICHSFHASRCKA
jgi:hypothetical protein